MQKLDVNISEVNIIVPKTRSIQELNTATDMVASLIMSVCNEDLRAIDGYTATIECEGLTCVLSCKPIHDCFVGKINAQMVGKTCMMPEEYIALRVFVYNILQR